MIFFSFLLNHFIILIKILHAFYLITRPFDGLPMAEYCQKVMCIHCLLHTWWQLITAAWPTRSIVLTSCMEFHCKWPKFVQVFD